jgi:hypothetical protein
VYGCVQYPPIDTTIPNIAVCCLVSDDHCFVDKNGTGIRRYWSDGSFSDLAVLHCWHVREDGFDIATVAPEPEDIDIDVI